MLNVILIFWYLPGKYFGVHFSFVKGFLAVVFVFSLFDSCAEDASVKPVPCLLMEQVQHIGSPRLLGHCVLLILHGFRLRKTGPFSLGFDCQELCLQLFSLHHCLSESNLKNPLSLQWGRVWVSLVRLISHGHLEVSLLTICWKSSVRYII